ncbi:MAG: proprotein convertase P-domain-containing protein [Phycisphaerae bacterium]|nr:proprotein convertase P-domain-containing protein [Saprospiraceae bacterium]
MKGLLALILFLPLLLPAQNYFMDDGLITDCSGTFYDTGGPIFNYDNSQNLSATICSDGTGGTHIRLSFTGVNLGAGDVLCFYDGPTTGAPLLSCSSDYTPGQPFVVQATSNNPTGCLTVTFQSNASGTASGWSAAISCVIACQTVLADLVSTTPAMVPADTGWIDICPGDRVFFNGVGIYPNNNFAYAQSDLTTSFEWNFGDGGIAYGPATSHRFDTPGGYYVQLLLTDTLGCHSGNFISQRVRVAHRPDFELTVVPQICAGDTLHLNATVDSTVTGATISVTTISASFDVEASRSDSLPLPDGTGETYQTSIFVSEFSPGQILTNANDLESICVTIEHSWMRDMEIRLTCPNGQSIILHDHPGNIGNEVYLGEPNDNDNFNPIPGLGYEYCWTPNATNPTWITYANTILTGITLPPGDYSTFEPISDLVGCPLNGEWTIGVIDLWPADNGFIFNWSLKFLDALYPSIETFTPQFLTWDWSNHPSIFYSTTDSISASPQNAGTAGYTFTVNDAFGCSWDTLVSIAVLPPTHPNCYTCATNFPALPDTIVCAGDPVLYNATSLAPPTQEVRFEAYPDYRLGNANHPPSNPYLSPIGVNSLGFNFLTIPVQQITSVCMDIETDFDGDLNIFLRAPGGQQLTLSTGNGGAGNNYKITCFSPSASVPIVGQAAPFNGTYIPEGNWNVLSGAQVNGDWSLVVSDGFAPAQFGTVKWWSIGFNAQNSVTYNWTNTTSLSCANCPTPIATPADTTIYILTATDSHNCVHNDTAIVNVATLFPAPTGLMVSQLGIGSMTWVWGAIQGALGYEVSVDGGPWQTPNNGLLSHIVSGLTQGQTLNISVRCISPSSCPPAVVNASDVFPPCTLFANVFTTSDVPCAGDTSGSVILSVSNAVSPVQFFLDNNPVPFPNGDLINILSAGNHFVIVLDAIGCSDTVNFTINEPLPIALMASGTNVLCNGSDSGTLMASATGGTGSIAFAWRDCLGGPTFGGASQTNFFAGCYAVTATDANGCTSTATVILTEPLPYDLQLMQDSVSCSGLSDGSANIVVMGGTAPYQYLWDNGATTATASNLDADFHFVTVTDANLCSATTFVEVLEPSPFLISSVQSEPASCFATNNGTATVFAAGGSPIYTYLWDDPTGQTVQKALALTAGIYNVTVTDRNGCTAQTSVTVTSPPDLLVNFTNLSAEKCAGDCLGQATVSPSGGVGGYQFDWQDNSIPAGAQTAMNLCPGSYQVTVTDGNGCTEVSQVAIAGAVPIDAQLNSLSPSCAGLQDGSIDTQISGGRAPYQYLWSNGSTSADLQNLPCGQYFLTLTDAAGCIKNYTVTLDCPQTIAIVSIVPQNVLCFGGANGSIAVQAQGGTAPLNYLWNDPNAQNTATAQNLSIGNYTVTVTDANGCNITTSTSVTQPPQLTVSTTHTNASCLSYGDGTATATPTGGVVPYTYSWGAAGSTQTIANLAAGTFFVTVTDANQCTATASAMIAQPLTGVSVTATQTRFACWGESDGEASVSASGSNGAPFTFIWSNGQVGGGASNLATGLYTVTATDSKGCTGTQIVAIQQLDSIHVLTAYSLPTCSGYSNGVVAVVLIEGGLGMGDSTQYNYQWSLPGAPNLTVVAGFTAGNYTLTVTDDQGCMKIHDFDVVAPLPVILQLAVEDVSCFGFADGAVSVSGVQNAVGAVNYQWNNNDSTPLNDSLPMGNYRVTATDSKGCTASAVASVQQPEPLGLAFQIQPLICSTDSNAIVTATVTGGTSAYNFQWDNGATTSEIKDLGPGSYALQVTDQNGCIIANSVNVSQPGALVATIETTEPECFGSHDGRIRVFVSGGVTPYRYSINGGPFGGGSAFLALTAGTYNLQVRDVNGCVFSTTTVLNQPVPVQVSVGVDTTLVLGDSLLLSPTVNNAVGMTHFEWESALVDSFTCASLPECEEIWIKPGFTNTFRVKVTDENGCIGEDEIRVTVEKPRGVYVPTGFTPNGDFENDLLVVHGKSLQVRKVLTFKIFDRWGEMIYEDYDFSVNDTSRGWDGTFRGQACDPAVFVWLLEAEYVDGFIELLKGNVTLVR